MSVRHRERGCVADQTDSPSSDWLRPPEEQEGLKRYIETFRERAWLIILTVVITTGIAVLYVATATKTYQAEADLLVTPVSSSDPVLASLGLIGGSSAPTQDAETAARLVTGIDVAEAVKKSLRSPLEPQQLRAKVTAVPVAQSSIVAITGSGSSPVEAKRVADAFATQVVTTRTEQMHAQIEQQLPALRNQLSAGGSSLGEESLSAQVGELQLLSTGPTPDMRVQTLAPLPTSPATPRRTLSIAAGIIAGIILGAVAAFAAQVLDPRLRREAQLRRLYRLPVLGRIPREARTEDLPLSPRRLSAATSEAYRTLRSTLTAATPEQQGGRTILVTGSAPSEGKTTTAVNLAASLALSGKRVILIESDLRRPVLGTTLKTAPRQGGVVGVLIENVALSDALVPAELYGSNLQLLLADYEGGWIADLFSIPAAERMIANARELADYVIVDSPPLNEVVDALPLARLVDTVLIVVKLGNTRLDKLSQLGELLAENDIRPAGFAVVGVPQPSRGEYHYYATTTTPAKKARARFRLPGLGRRS